MTKKVTKVQLATLEKLEASREKAREAVYATKAPRNDISWNDCYAASPKDVQEAYKKAREERDDFMHALVADGRAYWSWPNHTFTMNR
jgi:hypothetical protein